ncbi:MAG: CBS domain-containing protein [Elusimicrobia bacterium]|nr:CBS domain-containing protein [Elusimicrobiota bacterium]
MKVKDIMRKNPITVTADMTVRELARVFIDNRISGAPVVDGDEALLGVVSQTDLVRRDREMMPSADIPSFYHNGEKETYGKGFQIEDPDFTRVQDVMTPAVLSADENAPVEEVARLMLSKHVHRIVVTRDGKLTGIVTSMDMLRALLTLAAKARPAAKT